MNQDLRSRLDSIMRTQGELQESMHQLSEECARLDHELNINSEKPAIPPFRTEANPSQPDSSTPSKPVKRQDLHRKPKAKRGEWELNFGKIWLVRIGILLLLTGLVFLSTYAYKNWLFDAGPAEKVSFFMVISLSLTAVGICLENRKSDYLQYARVIAAGGLAAGYYTIYASHFEPSLLLVHSPVLAGILLTFWAGIMLTFAVWKKSRIVAVMAIGLAFYGTIVNPSGWISLFSALLLSSSGIWLMLRFNWIKLGLATMAAAYLSHAFWLSGWYPQHTSELVRVAYLASYWLLFSTALLLPQAKQLPLKLQRIFCTLNNAAAWTLGVFLIPEFIPHLHIGWISIAVGCLYLGIALATTSGKFWHRALASTWGYQGVMIASLGILIEATGYTRFLVLAVEACALLAGAKHFNPKLARIASGSLFALALLTSSSELNGGISPSWISLAALAFVFSIYTALVARESEHSPSHDIRQQLPLLPAAATWGVLTLGVFHQLPLNIGISGLWLISLVFLLGYFVEHPFHRIRGLKPLALLSIFPALTASLWFLNHLTSLRSGEIIIPIIGCATFWWMSRQLHQSWVKVANSPTHESQKTPPSNISPLEWVFGIILCSSIASALSTFSNSSSNWMLYGGLLALAGNAVSEISKRRSIGILALGFHAIALGALLSSPLQLPTQNQSLLSWMPALTLVVHLTLSDTIWSRLKHRILKPLLTQTLVLAVAIRAVIYFDHPSYTLSILGIALMAWSYYRNDRICAIIGGVIPLSIACLLAMFSHGSQDWGHFLPVAAVFITHTTLWLMSRDDIRWKSCRSILLGSGVVTLLIVSSLHVLTAFQGSGLAICWALIAALFFCAGLILQYRPHRLIGLFWLAAAVLHVLCIDVMRMETLGRILSFFTLGFILLALGFLYNRYQENIRKIL